MRGPGINTSEASPFFLVWTKTGPYPPRRTYQTLGEAQEAATAMARRYPDKRWFVLQSVERFWVNEAEDRASPPINTEAVNQ